MKTGVSGEGAGGKPSEMLELCDIDEGQDRGFMITRCGPG